MYLFKGIWKTQGQTETGCSIFDIIGPVEFFQPFVSTPRSMAILMKKKRIMKRRENHQATHAR